MRAFRNAKGMQIKAAHFDGRCSNLTQVATDKGLQPLFPETKFFEFGNCALWVYTL